MLTASFVQAQAIPNPADMGMTPAKIHAYDTGIAGTVGVMIDGDITLDTYDTFVDVVKDCCSNNSKNVIVKLNSTGGYLVVGKHISDYIKDRGWQTLAQGRCDSACTYIWLGGSTHLEAEGTILGFHAPSKKPDRYVPDQAGDALARQYYTSLGVSKKGVDWILASDKIRALTPTKANQMGITYQVIDAPVVKQLPPAIVGIWCFDEKADAFNRVTKEEQCTGKEAFPARVEAAKIGDCDLSDIRQFPNDNYRAHATCPDGLEQNIVFEEQKTGQLWFNFVKNDKLTMGTLDTPLPEVVASRPAAEPRPTRESETRTVRRGKPERVVEPRREVRREPRHEPRHERHVVSRPHGLRINVPAIAFRILRHFF
jgi:hypothetical protein